MKKILVVVLVLFTLTITQAQESPKTIPSFSIIDIDGNVFTNEDMSSKTSSYIVYFNPDCGHCEQAFQKLNKEVEVLKLRKVTFYAVAANSKEKTEAFFNDIAPEVLKLKNLKILLDEDFVFADAFKVGSYPTTYFYDKKGDYVNRFEGADDVLEPIVNLK